jgi:hypothetical protein
MRCLVYAEWKKVFRTGLEAHLLLEGCVASRFKMLVYRGKMPLPLIIRRIEQK